MAETLKDGVEGAAERLSVPAVEIPVSARFSAADLEALSGFAFAAALEDRSGRFGGGSELKLDLSPVTDAINRVEERLEEATDRMTEAFKQPVKLDWSRREFRRAVKESL